MVGGEETGSQGRKYLWQDGGLRTRRFHIRMWINWEEQLGRGTDCATQGSSMGNKASKPLTEKPVGVEVVGETPSLTGEFIGEIHRVLECTQTHPPGNQHHKGPIWLWVAGKVTENWQWVEQMALFPLGPFPYIQHHNTATWVAPPWWTPKAPPLTTNWPAETKKIWPKWKNRSKLQKKYN